MVESSVVSIPKSGACRTVARSRKLARRCPQRAQPGSEVAGGRSITVRLARMTAMSGLRSADGRTSPAGGGPGPGRRRPVRLRPARPAARRPSDHVPRPLGGPGRSQGVRAPPRPTGRLRHGHRPVAPVADAATPAERGHGLPDDVLELATRIFEQIHAFSGYGFPAFLGFSWSENSSQESEGPARAQVQLASRPMPWVRFLAAATL
jgi:hypothetical protein